MHQMRHVADFDYLDFRIETFPEKSYQIDNIP